MVTDDQITRLKLMASPTDTTRDLSLLDRDALAMLLIDWAARGLELQVLRAGASASVQVIPYEAIGTPPETCPTCGSPVRVVGRTTLHYEPMQPTLDAVRLAAGQAAIDWARNAVTCVFCVRGWVGSKHAADCPLAPLDAESGK